MKITSIWTIGAVIGILGGIFMWQTGASTSSVQTKTALVDVTLPASFSQAALMGEKIFQENCSQCHGANGSGVDGAGPPLIHKIYEPSHHGDQAFLIAALNGVRGHHWPFGNMPAIEGMTPEKVAKVVAYIREIQRANGID